MLLSVYVDKEMRKTKIVITLAVIVALTFVIVVLASAQITASQTYAGATPRSTAPNGGFLGWMVNCFGFRNNQPYNYQNVAPEVHPTSCSVPVPNQSGYGYETCWAR